MRTFISLLDEEELAGSSLLAVWVRLLVWVEDNGELAVSFANLLVWRGLGKVEDGAGQRGKMRLLWRR